jgi:hypothetical protein
LDRNNPENGICAPWHAVPDDSTTKIAKMRRSGFKKCRAENALWLRWKREGRDPGSRHHPYYRLGGVRFNLCQLCLLARFG